MDQLRTPVLFMIFNRPDTTRVAFEEIRKARPTQLFIAGDGPRADHPDDAERVRLARRIIERVDWPCEIHTLFQEQNLGCHRGPPAAIDWFFEHVEAGIILEDDCVPDPSFFSFCSELLERYADDPRVMQISGNCFQEGNPRFRPQGSYYFSFLPYLWGWATWRRAWNCYDIDMKEWPVARERGTLRKILADPAVYEYWENLWDSYASGARTSWDRPWVFACLLHDGLSITPAENLVSNIGFGPDATHTKNPDASGAHLRATRMPFPLVHPIGNAKQYREADAFASRTQFGINNSIREHVLGPLRRSFPGPYAFLKKILKKRG